MTGHRYRRSGLLTFLPMTWENFKGRFLKACDEFLVHPSKSQELLDYAQKLFEHNFPVIFDPIHLSLLLGYELDLLYRISNDSKKFYRSFSIPKNNGKKRLIKEPYPTLKEIQNWILKNVLEKKSPSIFAKAYIKKKNLRENVRFHKSQAIVLKIDVKDFFGSISFSKVFHCFETMGYSNDVAGLLAGLCCYNDSLPQGAPTSPCISNLVATSIDKRIGAYAIKNGLRYTRYSDDITISGDFEKSEIGKAIHLIKKILEQNGFSIQKKKMKVLRQSNRQSVTGVIVNQKLSISRKVKQKIRQEIHFIKKFGLDSHLEHTKSEKKNYIAHLKGKINWILEIESENKEFESYRTFLNESSSREKVVS